MSGKKPTNKEYAKESALHGYSAIMGSLRSVIIALEPHQNQMVQGVGAGGQPIVDDVVYLQQLAKSLLKDVTMALTQGGFIANQRPPQDKPPAELKIVSEEP